MTQDIEFGPAIDWTKPIEAVRKADGRTVPVTLRANREGEYADRHTKECPAGDTNEGWHEDGRDWCRNDAWFIRNVAQPNPLPADDTVVVKRMTEEEALAWVNSNSYIEGRKHILHAFRELGIIRTETPAERFTRDTGLEATPEVQKAIEWAMEKGR